MSPPARRRLLAASGAVALLGAAGCAAAPAGDALPVPRELADGVWMFAGRPGGAAPANGGRIGNSGFVVGEQGVVAVDTGTSLIHGRALLAAIARVAARPVRLAIVTHVRPEFLFGGGAFRERGIPVAMHERSARLMAARCETCLKTLRATLGDAALAGTALYVPDRLFAGSTTLTDIGRPLRVLHFGASSGPGDLAVLDPRSGVLFAGGLVDVQRIPDVQDGDLDGWRRALRELASLRPAIVVPGHGAATSPEVFAEVERYLLRLDERTRALAEAGTSLIDVPDAAALPDYRDWDQYELTHRRNALVFYLRHERALMFK